MPDYTTYQQKERVQHGALSSSSVDEPGPRYITSADYARLCGEIRAQLKEDIARVEKAYPPSSSLAPGSVRERSDRDFSIYVGAGM